MTPETHTVEVSLHVFHHLLAHFGHVMHVVHTHHARAGRLVLAHTATRGGLVRGVLGKAQPSGKN